jgi:hypothetical protein
MRLLLSTVGQVRQHAASLRSAQPDCIVNGIMTTPVTLRVFDLYGRETVVTESRLLRRLLLADARRRSQVSDAVCCDRFWRFARYDG